jgi:hypothetical protein
MKTLKTKGIIISENNMGDFDKMVTILTPTGKIGCAAKGARRPKSLLMAGTQYVLGIICYIKEQILIELILVILLKFFIILGLI